MCSARNKVVSETLLVKERGAIPEEKLANKFCLKLPGWCPCLNCHDFDQPVHLWIAACNKKMLGRLKRKAPENFGECSKKSKKKFRKRPIEAAEEKSDNDENANIAGRFQFDYNFDELQKFKEGECPENTTKSNDWALRNFHAWRAARNEKHPDD